MLLVGRAEEITAHLPDGAAPEGVEVLDARELIAMDDEPAPAVRTRKDSSIVRCAQAVRDGCRGRHGRRRQHRARRWRRRCCGWAESRVWPDPRSRCRSRCRMPHPQLLVDGGATVDAAPEWLVQFALMGREYARTRLGIDEPSVGLLSNGEEEGKGDEIRKHVFELMRKVPGFVGNVEGRDFMHAGTVGRDRHRRLHRATSPSRRWRAHCARSPATCSPILDSTPEAREAAKTIMPLLLDAAETYDPDTHRAARCSSGSTGSA